MNAIQNFAFEEHLIRVIDQSGEPWFVGKDVCGALAIKNHNDALSRLDDDEKGVAITDPLSRGGSQEAVIVSEPGVYRLVFSSRKEEAERFKRWLAHEVLPQIRKTGTYGQPRPETMERLTLEGEAPLMARVEAVKVAARLWGKDRARSLWSKLGLPAVPPASQWEGEGQARACLDHLLAAIPQASDGRTLYRLIMDAIDGDENARTACLYTGIRIAEDGEAFGVAHVAEELTTIYDGTEWQARGWRMVLRRLQGAVAGDTQKVGKAMRPSRIIWLPLAALDRTP